MKKREEKIEIGTPFHYSDSAFYTHSLWPPSCKSLSLEINVFINARHLYRLGKLVCLVSLSIVLQDFYGMNGNYFGLNLTHFCRHLLCVQSVIYVLCLLQFRTFHNCESLNGSLSCSQQLPKCVICGGKSLNSLKETGKMRETPQRYKHGK